MACFMARVSLVSVCAQRCESDALARRLAVDEPLAPSEARRAASAAGTREQRSQPEPPPLGVVHGDGRVVHLPVELGRSELAISHRLDEGESALDLGDRPGAQLVERREVA